MLDCENYIIYRKVNSNEIINIGDVIMLDPENGYVTLAVRGTDRDFPINTRMVVGICIDSNNTMLPNIVIDGGKSVDTERKTINSYSDSVDIIILDSSSSEQNKREIIKVAYTGEWLVNVCGFVDIGDKLCISNHPGKAKAIDYIDKDYFITRTIGKVVKFMKDKEQVKVLLDIE